MTSREIVCYSCLYSHMIFFLFCFVRHCLIRPVEWSERKGRKSQLPRMTNCTLDDTLLDRIEFSSLRSPSSSCCVGVRACFHPSSLCVYISKIRGAFSLGDRKAPGVSLRRALIRSGFCLCCCVIVSYFNFSQSVELSDAFTLIPSPLFHFLRLWC